jgi:aminomethyltransferase
MTIGTTTPASPLIAEHHGLGAQITDFAGWQMPLKYDSELDEHHTVRTTAGVFDLSHMGEILVEGSDAGALLDYALAGELSKIDVGRAKYSLLCNSAGGVIDDLVAYRLADDRFLIVANATNASTVHRELASRAAGFGAEVHDQSAETGLLAVQGPAAQDIILSLVPTDQVELVETLRYYAAHPAVVAGIDVLLARTGYTGEDGFELYVAHDESVALWRAVFAATTARGGRPAGLACRDTLRLEAGMALYGHELNLDTNPYEAGLGRVVKLNKNFVGRDALQKLSEQPACRALTGLAGTGRRAGRAGYTVYDAAGTSAVGAITSGALSPTLGHPIALAYVDVGFEQPGTELSVDIRGKKEPFTVTTTPFYRRP